LSDNRAAGSRWRVPGLKPANPPNPVTWQRAATLKGSFRKNRVSVRGRARASSRRPSRTRPGRGDRIAISAYLGKSDAFDRAIASFAETYADQNEWDFSARVQMEPAAVVASPSAAKR
jgi:hypothetical protein